MNTIRELRTKKGLTQTELGEILGVTKNSISYYENSKRQPTPDMLVKMADLFGVSIDVILGRKEEQPAAPGWKDINTADFSPSKKSNPLPDLFHTVKIPILGSVRAGYDWLAAQEVIGWVEVEEDIANRFPDVFALYVKGDSMEPEIRHNDIAICVPQSQVDNGSIAIICINGDEGTIKRVRVDRDGINIIPSNSRYSTKHYTPDEVTNIPITIQALVIEIRRRYA